MSLSSVLLLPNDEVTIEFLVVAWATAVVNSSVVSEVVVDVLLVVVFALVLSGFFGGLCCPPPHSQQTLSAVIVTVTPSAVATDTAYEPKLCFEVTVPQPFPYAPQNVHQFLSP